MLLTNCIRFKYSNLLRTRAIFTLSVANLSSRKSVINLFNQEYPTDEWTNINRSIQEKLERNLLHQKYHPLNHLTKKIKHFFNSSYTWHNTTPLFTIFDNFKPIVSLDQNFDSLLVSKDHVSRSKKDCFYVNRDHLLRAHTTAHSSELIRSGLNAFLTFGDVYRRDEIDAKHYPVFHQCDGVRLYTKTDLFPLSEDVPNPNKPDPNSLLDIFEKEPDCLVRNNEKQRLYTLDATKLVELEMKNCLTNLVQFIFGSSHKLNMRWIEADFPFTHPSWELEIEYKGTWYEVLGCGVLEREILKNAGADKHIGWAFGLGLERWSMILNDINDIRIFWSTDSGFLSQFKYEDPKLVKNVKYKPVSVHPQCINDISFWLPSEEGENSYSSNDFYDLVREVAGDLCEQVELKDVFTHKKTSRTSHCYRIVYRSMERNLTQEEVNALHKEIEKSVVESLGVTIR